MYFIKQKKMISSNFQKSPNVTKDQRTTSENYFIEFRKSKSPYEFCRYLFGENISAAIIKKTHYYNPIYN